MPPKWKWLFEAPLSRPWRDRLEIGLGVVLSGAAMVALSTTIRPDPSKLASARVVPTNAPGAPREPELDTPRPPPKPTMPPELVKAVRAGDLATMQRLFARGIPLEGMLTVAAQSGRRPTVLWLLDHGADVHDEEGSAYGPVLSADGHADIVALLLDRGAAEPSLTAAAEANAVNAVDRLLTAHAAVNPRGDSPLAAAAASTRGTGPSKRLIVSRLLAEGAEPNRDHGVSALAGAVQGCDEGQGNASIASDCMTIVRLLLSHGAQVKGDALASALSLDDGTREAPLDALLAMPIEEGVTAVALAQASNVNPREIKRLVAKGVDWAWHDGEEDAALPVLAAVKRGDRDSVRALLDAGAPVDVHFKDGSSALREAIDGAANNADEARIVELLVARGANVNRRFRDGRTPLFAAAESGDLRVLNVLLDRGARVNDLVLDDTALDGAEQSGHLPAARVLHAHGARRAPRPGL
ncbi:hypothetical protein BH11MYX4_BH11MYX4_51770 [soil metagenome]